MIFAGYKISSAKAIIFVLLLAFVSLVAYFSNQIKVEGLWFVFPYVGSIRISTVLTAVVCFTFVLYLTRRTGLKSLYYAALAVIFSMALYELVWWNSAVVLDNWEQRNWAFAALLGWIFLGVREVFQTRPQRISIILYATYVASMIAWVSLGFKFSVPGADSYDFAGELFNVVSKLSLSLAFSFHIILAKTNSPKK